MVLCVFWVRWGERSFYIGKGYILDRQFAQKTKQQTTRRKEVGKLQGASSRIVACRLSDSQTHLSFRPVSHVHRGQLDDDTWWERGCRSRREAIAARRERGWEPELSGGCWDGLEEKKVEDWQINTDICWGLIGGGERRRLVTTVKYCSLFQDELHFLLGPPGIW